MRRLILITGIGMGLALIPTQGFGQEVAEPQLLGYTFLAPGATFYSGGPVARTFHAGVGGEGVFYKGLGVGAEIGAVGVNPGGGFGLVSTNVSYRFGNGTFSPTVVPFVTGGYSLRLNKGDGWSPSQHLVNFGGGVDYWFNPDLALRLEVRDHVYPEDRTHFLGFRVGLVW